MLTQCKCFFHAFLNPLLTFKARQRRVEQLEREKEEKRRLKGQNSAAASPKEKVERPSKPSTPSAPIKEKVKEPEPVPSDSSSSSKRNERLSSDKPKKKAAISDSDDGSDGEWKGSRDGHSKLKHRKKSISKKTYFDDSSSGEEPVADTKDAIVSTRKSTQKSKADAVLDGDPTIKISFGFAEVSGEDSKFTIGDDADIVSNSDVIDDLIPITLLPPPHPSKVIENSDKEFVFIDNLSDPRKTLASWKSFDGKPKLVSPVPDWLSAKFQDWSMKRQDVDIISPQDFNKIRNHNKRKIVTDREFDARCNVGSSSAVDEKRMKIEDILMEQMPDIVSVTPEPTKTEEITVEPEAQTTETEVESEQADEAEINNVGVEKELDIEVEENFKGYSKVEANFRLMIPFAESDANGNRFSLTSFIEDDEPVWSDKMQPLINPELQKHYLQVLKDDKSFLSDVRKISVHPPAKKQQRKRKEPEVEEESPKSEPEQKPGKPRKRKLPVDKQTQQPTQAFSGGLKVRP